MAPVLNVGLGMASSAVWYFAWMGYYELDLLALAVLGLAVVRGRPGSWTASVGSLGALLAGLGLPAALVLWWVGEPRAPVLLLMVLGVLGAMAAGLLILHVSFTDPAPRWRFAGMVLAASWAGLQVGIFSGVAAVVALCGLGCCLLPFWMLRVGSRRWPPPRHAVTPPGVPRGA